MRLTPHFCGISNVMEILHSGARQKCLFSVYKTRAAKAMANAVLAASGLLGAALCSATSKCLCQQVGAHAGKKQSLRDQ